MIFLRVLFVPFILLASSCGALDSQQRHIRISGGRGDVFTTDMSDEQLTMRGHKVLYRFKTLKNAVYLNQGGSSLIPFSEGADPSLGLKSYETLERPNPVSLSETQGTEDLYEDFKNANKAVNIGSIKLTNKLRKVRIALIDSGVVSQGQEWSVKQNVNLTNDSEKQNWSPHGTALASLILGYVHGSKHVPPLAQNIDLLSYKISFEDDENSQSPFGDFQLAAALDQAVADGADVVNLSFSYRDPLPRKVEIAERVIMANARNTIFVVAAGNSNQGQFNNAPASYGLPNMLVVGSHRSDLQKAGSSNFGDRVDVTARGTNFLLWTNQGHVANFSGTSFAAPVVASAVALALKQRDFNEPTDQTIGRVRLTASPSYFGSNGRESRYGRLNVEKLVGSK